MEEKEEDKLLDTAVFSLPADHSGEELCETCPSFSKCSERENSADSWILEDQHLHCHEEVGRADYQEDEYWLMKAMFTD